MFSPWNQEYPRPVIQKRIRSRPDCETHRNGLSPHASAALPMRSPPSVRNGM